MRNLEWDDMGVKVDGRQLHHLRFADDIVLVTPSISQAERMLTEFDETCGCIGLQLNLQKTMFMRNGAGQEETSGLGSVQEHRGCSEEYQEHSAPCSSRQHHYSYFPL
ncbi:hypothetical protein RB195_024398 [Necator americanus]|uniref:Reverse transcriptase domain-containing protein n=1 Tax=Necator americanus TaxID=51031 RepID=A0ABR1EQB2_NECAM